MTSTHRADSNAFGAKNPSLLDRCFQLTYTLAYRLHLIWTFIFRPATEGVWIAVWAENHLLLIKNSYRGMLTLPGGGIDGDETAEAAAVRELREEVGLQVNPEQLTLFKQYISHCEYKHDTINVFELQLSHQPNVTIDNREVAWARFSSANEAQSLRLFPALSNYLKDKTGQANPL